MRGEPNAPPAKQLDEPHAPLEQSPRQQATAAEIGSLGPLEPVQGRRLSRLAIEGGHFGHGQLHAGGHFIRVNPG